MEHSGEAGITFPRFMAPFLSSGFKRRVKADTEFSVSFNYQERPEYTRIIAGAGWILHEIALSLCPHLYHAVQCLYRLQAGSHSLHLFLIDRWHDRKHFFLPRVNGVNLEVLPYDRSQLKYGAFVIDYYSTGFSAGEIGTEAWPLFNSVNALSTVTSSVLATW